MTLLADEMDPGSGDELSGTKKRSNSDATEYPRRRATIAVRVFEPSPATF